MKTKHAPKKVRFHREQPWHVVAPLAIMLVVGSLGAYLTLSSRAETTTFKLFAPAWKGLGGDANLPNARHFTQIIGRSRTTVPADKVSPGTVFYKYSLGPYVTIANVKCSIIPPTQPYLARHPGTCAKENPILDAGMARGLSSNKVVWANEFNNNFLLVPDQAESLSYIKADAAKLVNSFDGLLSDNMGYTPIAVGSNYLNERPRKPGTTRAYTPAEWITAEVQMLQAKKQGLPAGKTLIINGLVNGQVYFDGAASETPQAFANMTAVTGVMADRVFRAPGAGAEGWDDPALWKKDVDMIADVQAKGKRGYWWTRCWAGTTESCQSLPSAGQVISQWRRFSLASYLLGAGSNSYFNFDTNKNDESAANYLGPGEREANNAEWFENDYARAERLGTASGSYSRDGGGVYKRTFGAGIVVVNPTGAALSIALGSSRFTDFDGTVRTGSYSLPAHTGNVLLTTGGGGDTTKPTVSRTAPAGGATVSGTLTATGTATDNVGVTKVDLLVDGAVKGTDTTLPAVSIAVDSRSISNGSHTLALKAYDAAGNTAQTTDISITVSNGSTPPPPTISSFTANPNPITAGGKTWLSWATANTTRCSVNPDGVQNTTLFTWQTPALSTVGTKTYTLDCVNSSGVHATRPLTITVQAATTPPGKPVFTASATAIRVGQSVTLSWSSTGATSCSLSPGNVTTSGPTGSRVVSPTSTTRYTVTCRNAAGSSASDPLTITVTTTPPPAADPVIVSLTADPAAIDSGQRSTIRWATSNVRPGGCRLTPSPLTATDPNGSWTTPPLTTSMTYLLTCVNSVGRSTSKSVSVVVGRIPAPPPPDPEDPEDPSDEDYEWDEEYFYDEESGENIDNGAIDEDLSGLAVLDPSNITDEAKVNAIDHVEYFLGDKLIQTDTTEPFALDTKKLKNGTYTITEKTYYTDGSTSEITRTVDIQNTAASGSTKKGIVSIASSRTHLGAGVGGGLLLVLGITAGFCYLKRRHAPHFLATEPQRAIPAGSSQFEATAAELAASLGSGTVFSPTPHTQSVTSADSEGLSDPVTSPQASSPDILSAVPARAVNAPPALTTPSTTAVAHDGTPQSVAAPPVSSTPAPNTLPPATNPLSKSVPAHPAEGTLAQPAQPVPARQSSAAASPANPVATPVPAQQKLAATKQPYPKQPLSQGADNPNHLNVPHPPHDPISPNWGE